MIKIKRILLLFACIISIGIMQAYAVGSSSTNDTIGQKEAASSLDSVLLIEDDSVAAETYDPLCNEIEEAKCTWWKENFGVLADNNTNATKIQLYINDILAISAIGLCVLAFICVVIVGLIRYLKNVMRMIKMEHVMQILLISVIVIIAIYSDSHWAYLALVILCVLGIFKYNKELSDNFNEILRNYSGVVAPSSQKEVNKKIERELDEIVQENASPSGVSQEGTSVSTSNNKRTMMQKYRGIESLALDYLGRRYPKLQRYVTIQGRELRRIVLDGFIEEENKNIIIEVKYISTKGMRMRYLNPLNEAMDYLTKKTGKWTELLLFIVTDNPNMKTELESQYANIECITKIEVYTKEELQNKSE